MYSHNRFFFKRSPPFYSIYVYRSHLFHVFYLAKEMPHFLNDSIKVPHRVVFLQVSTLWGTFRIDKDCYFKDSCTNLFICEPSALPLTLGMMAPMTLPMSFIDDAPIS